MTLRLETRHDLEHAVRLVSWLARPAVGQVQVRLPWLAPDERDRVGRTLTRRFNDCGCLWGAPAFATALAWGAAASPWAGGTPSTALAASLASAVVAALAGKAAALAWSAWRLRVLLHRLARGAAPGPAV